MLSDGHFPSLAISPSALPKISLMRLAREHNDLFHRGSILKLSTIAGLGSYRGISILGETPWQLSHE